MGATETGDETKSPSNKVIVSRTSQHPYVMNLSFLEISHLKDLPAKLHIVNPPKETEEKKEEKEKHLSEYYSHDFNFFLKKKDPEFFEGTLRGILSSKMEKTLVDFYLLDMHD